MKLRLKRIVSVILSLTLLLGTCTIPAYAADDEVKYQISGSGDWTTSSLADAVSKIGAQTGTIEVLRDINLSAPVSIKGDITIVPTDGSTVTISRGFASGSVPSFSSTGDAMFHLAAKKTLTFGDSSEGTLILDGQKDTYTSCAGPIIYVNATSSAQGTLHLKSNVVLQNNKNSGNGGAVDLEGYVRTTIEGTSFSGNVSEKHGGALYIDNNNMYNNTYLINADITGAKFTGNSAKEKGGAICTEYGGTKISFAGSTFAGNSAKQGSAIYFGTFAYRSERTGSSALEEAAVIDGCTFTDNTYNNEPPTMTSMGAFTCEVSNTIWIGNVPSKYTDKTIVLKNSNSFDNETAADIATYAYDWGYGTKSTAPVLYLDDSFSSAGSGTIRVMVGAYGAYEKTGVDVFKASNRDKAAEFSKLLVQADDEWNMCQPGSAVKFVANPDNGGGIMLKEATFTVTVEDPVNGTLSAEAEEHELTDVPAGTTVTVIVTPDDGYMLKDESLKATYGDGNEVSLYPSYGKDGEYSFTMPTADVTVTAEFVESGHSITASSDASHGTIEIDSDSDDGLIQQGTRVDVTVTPDAGYEVDRVEVTKQSGDTVEFTPDESEDGVYAGHFEMPDDDVTVNVTYKAIQYHIVALPSAGGSVTLSTEAATVGTQVTLTISPESEYSFVSVTVTGDKSLNVQTQKQDDGTYTFIMPASDVTVTASFAQIVYDVVYEQSPSDGTVSVDKEHAPAGEKVNVSVSPDEGYEVESVEVVGPDDQPVEVTDDGDNHWSFDMPSGGATVTVTLKATEYSVTAVQPDGGSIDTGVSTATIGQEIIITVTPDTEHSIVSVSVKDAGNSDVEIRDKGDGTYTFTMPASDVTVTAELEVKVYSVQYPETIPNASLTNKTGEAAVGEPVTFTVTPDEGYEVDSVEILDSNGEPVEATNDGAGHWSFDMPSGGATVTVSTKASEYNIIVVAPVHGTISASVETAVMGEEITVTAAADKESLTADVFVSDFKGNPVPVTKGEDGTYTFIMPASDVTVTAVFVEQSEENGGYNVVIDPAQVLLDEGHLPDGLTAEDFSDLNIEISGKVLDDIRQMVHNDNVDYTGEDWTNDDGMPEEREDIFLHLVTKVEVSVTEYSLDPSHVMSVDIKPYYQVIASDSNVLADSHVSKVLSKTVDGADEDGWVGLSLDGESIPITIPVPTEFAEDGSYIQIDHHHEDVLMTSFTQKLSGGSVQFTNSKGFSVFTLTLETHAQLNGLTSSSGSITPEFDPDTTEYESSVGNGTDKFTFTPEVADGLHVTVTVDGEEVEPNEDGSYTVDVEVGQTDIQISVSGDEGSNLESTDYTLSVTRASASHGGGGSWTPAPAPAYDVKFDSKGGSDVSAQNVQMGNKAKQPSDPSKPGFDFGGWYTDSACTQAWDFDKNAVYRDIVLYAKWTRMDDGVSNWLNLDSHDAYIKGYGDGSVRPMSSITRAEVVTIFYRLLNDGILSVFHAETCSFTDVPPDAWYAEAVSTLVNAGIVEGYSKYTFGPDKPITRAEFATICARMGTINTLHDAEFSDVKSGSWYYHYVLSAMDSGWVFGYPDGSFRPDANISRAEAVTMVNRMLHRDSLTTSGLLDGMTMWSDNPRGTWFFLAIQEASNGHDYDFSDGHEYWTEMNL